MRRCALFVVAFLVATEAILAQLPVAVGSEFQVNSYTPDIQAYPVLDFDAGGGFVVVWSSNQDGAPSGIFGRRFGSAGNPERGATRRRLPPICKACSRTLRAQASRTRSSALAAVRIASAWCGWSPCPGQLFK
jgi:hypothetical protein